MTTRIAIASFTGPRIVYDSKHVIVTKANPTTGIKQVFLRFCATFTTVKRTNKVKTKVKIDTHAMTCAFA